ncbi:MAG TPA: hypothetical protein VEH06_07210 [Candidatus Bathyarchaeia archaeon]|nr:hypothetical protein [Candidatus Bathyarchaeia archaeon]
MVVTNRVSNGGNNVRGGTSDDRSDGSSRGGGNNVRSGRSSAHDSIRTLVLVDFRLWALRQIVMLLRQWPRY